MINGRICLVLLLAVAPVSGAVAVPVLNSSAVFAGNGNTFETYDAAGGITWSDANAFAIGLGGHLATVTSAAEGAFIDSLASNTPYWLGGHQAPGSPEPAGGWSWVTGEAWSYTAWAGGEPNNQGGAEDALINWGGGSWNDAPSGFLYSNGGLIVEYEVPAPAAGLLLLAGLPGLVAVRRKRSSLRPA